MASSKSFLFVFLLLLFIFLGIVWNSSPISYTENKEASSSENNDYYKLKSIDTALKLTIEEKHQEVFTKEEKIQFENPVKHASEAEGNIYELQKQIFELRQEMEMQRKRSLEVKTRAEITDSKVSELSSKLENIDGEWLLSKLGLNANKTMTYVMTLWDQHLSQTLQKKWIPSIKDVYVTLTIYIEPKVQYLTDKSIKMLYASKQALTSHLIQGFDVSYYYLEVIRIVTTAKPNLEKVQATLEPFIEIVRQGFNKLAEILKRRNNEVK